MPIEFDGPNSKVSANAIEAQSGSTITIQSGHNLSGGGSGLTGLNATNLGSGTVPDARFPSTLPAASGVNLTALNATQLTSGTLPMARLSGTLPALNGSALTNLPASSVTAKTVHVSYDLSTASGTVDVTSFGFSPSALFGWFIVNPSDTWGFGFTDFTMARGLHTTDTTTAVLQGTAAFALFRVSSGNDQHGAASAITNGIRLTWTKSGSPTGTGLLYLMGIK